MSMPITVLMSVFNGERWLSEALESVLNQSFGDFEFIVVNDGSTDTSLDVVHKFAKQDKRIRIVDKRNSGLADSLNQGINLAQGDWIARIDADDVCEPERLAKQYQLACSDDSLVLIGSGLIEIDEQGRSLKTYRYPKAHKQLKDSLLQKRRFFAHSSALFRSQAARNLGGYRPRIRRAQDFDLWLRLSEVGAMACIDEPLVRIRKHGEQVSHDEGGRRQIIDSRMALVSYLLRRKGATDPVGSDQSEEDVLAFRYFIERGVEKDGLIEYRNFVSRIKAELSESDFVGILSLLTSNRHSMKFLVRYLHQMIVGETLGRRLAEDWMKHSGAICAD